MLELAGALFQKVRVLLLDETTASLTPHEVARLSAVLRRLRSEGVALAFISHRMDEIFDLCDRITVLRDGEIVGERKTNETSREELLRLMVGRDVQLLQTREKATVGKPLLEVRGLGRVRKFADVSFTVHAGEVVGLAGLVGAGRTDIARSLFGLLPADTGEIWIDGTPAVIRSPQDAMRLGLALVPEDRQRHGAVLPLSLSENTTLSVLNRVSPGGWLRNAPAHVLTKNWIDRLGVRCKSADQPIGELSGGNQQKIVLSKWLETNPRILILDEPTRGIDVRAKSEVHKLIATLAQEGLAVLLISSDLPEVLTMSDRVLVLREGRLVREFGRDTKRLRKPLSPPLRASRTQKRRPYDGPLYVAPGNARFCGPCFLGRFGQFVSAALFVGLQYPEYSAVDAAYYHRRTGPNGGDFNAGH